MHPWDKHAVQEGQETEGGEDGGVCVAVGVRVTFWGCEGGEAVPVS